MKTALIAVIVVSLAELLNTKHFIVETDDIEADPYRCENAQHRGTSFAFLLIPKAKLNSGSFIS